MKKIPPIVLQAALGFTLISSFVAADSDLESLKKLYQDFEDSIREKDFEKLENTTLNPRGPLQIIYKEDEGYRDQTGTMRGWFRYLQTIEQPYEIRIIEPKYHFLGDVAVSEAVFHLVDDGVHDGSGLDLFFYIRDDQGQWKISAMNNTYYDLGTKFQETPSQQSSIREIRSLIRDLSVSISNKDSESFQSFFLSNRLPFAELGSVRENTSHRVLHFSEKMTDFPGHQKFEITEPEIHIVDSILSYVSFDYEWIQEGHTISSGNAVGAFVYSSEKGWTCAGIYLQPKTKADPVAKVFGTEGLYFKETLDYHVTPDPNEPIIYTTRFKNLPAYNVVSYRNHAGQWKALGQPAFAEGARVADPTFSRDGKRVYFSSNRDPAAKEKRKNLKIWRSVRSEQGWSAPEYVGFDHFDSGLYHPAIDDQGNIYFHSYLDGKGQIFRSRKNESGFEDPVPLSNKINQYSVGDPCISKDGKILIYYVAKKKGSHDLADLYLSTLDDEGNWSEGKRLGKDVNTNGWDFAPCLTPNGHYLLFSSWEHLDWKKDKSMDYLYWVPTESFLKNLN